MRTFLGAAAVALLAAGPAGAETEPVRFEAALARIDELVLRHMKESRVPGMAVVLSRGDATLRISTYGVADVKLGTKITEDTLFEIGSLSKSFTAVALLQLAEKHDLDLYAPVKKVLPWFHVAGSHRPLTAHDLLSHSAGLPVDRDDIPTSLFQTLALKDVKPAFAPGAGFRYSNWGYQVLGWMLETLTGQRYGLAIRSRIFEPLGMTSSNGAVTFETMQRLATGYRPFHDDRPFPPARPLVEAPGLEYGSGDAAVASTPRDMDAYVRMLLNRGAGPRGRLLSEESFRLLVNPVIRVTPFDPMSYAYGLYVQKRDGHTLLRHTGATLGMSAMLTADLEDSLGVVVFENSANPDAAPGPVGDFALKVLRAVVRMQPLPEVPDSGDDLENASEYAGTYEDADGRKMTIVVEGKRLALLEDGKRFPLNRRGRESFQVDHPDFALYLLRFGRQAERVVEVFHGGRWYRTDRYQGPRSFPFPKEWAGYVGHYRTANLWFSNFRIVVRKGKLLMITPQGLETLLVPAEPGWFQMGEEHTAERIRFDLPVRDRMQRANFSGVDYYRTFTP